MALLLQLNDVVEVLIVVSITDHSEIHKILLSDGLRLVIYLVVDQGDHRQLELFEGGAVVQTVSSHPTLIIAIDLLTVCHVLRESILHAHFLRVVEKLVF